jgi:Fe-S-cluster containining protein
LGQHIETLVSDYLVRIGKRYHIKEVKIEGGFYCLFFDEKKRQCLIYDVRPEQCRTFPFWEHFKDKPDAAFGECPGVRKTQV